MDADTTSTFGHAARCVGELNDRQREVLRLIAQGRTNAEIGEALGLTFTSAKWNVSEILSKLGLESREEAAAFYRWQRRPARRFARGLAALLPLGPLKTGIAAGTVGGLAVAGFALAAFAASAHPAPADTPGRPYYLEAVMTRTDPQATTEQATRWWFEDGAHQRIETDMPEVLSAAPGHEVDFGAPGTFERVRDGVVQWESSSSAPFYTRLELPRPVGQMLSDEGMAVGRVDAVDLDTLLAELGAQQPQGWAKVTGHARVLGREVAVIEYGGMMTETPGGKPMAIERLWVDPERMLVMQRQRPGGLPGPSGIVETTEVTVLRYGEHPPADRLAWTPAPSQVEARCQMPRDGQAAMAGGMPDGLLDVPVALFGPGSVAVSTGATTAPDGSCAGGETRVEVTTVAAGTPRPWLTVRQSRTDPASLLPQGESETVTLADGAPAALVEEDGGVLTLAWAPAGLAVQLQTDTLDRTALLAFASAMAP